MSKQNVKKLHQFLSVYHHIYEKIIYDAKTQYIVTKPMKTCKISIFRHFSYQNDNFHGKQVKMKKKYLMQKKLDIVTISSKRWKIIVFHQISYQNHKIL